MKEQPTIIPHFSLNFEKDRIRDCLERIKWFQEHKYTVLLPGNKEMSDVTIDDFEALSKIAEHEYDESYYSKIADTLLADWSYFSVIWTNSSFEDIKLSFKDTYNVYLTAYGVGGSYDLPNTIIVNVKRIDRQKISSVIFHEILHLSIEHLIQKHKVAHWYKERIVDLYFKKIFPEKSFEQNLPHEVLSVNSIFEKFYTQPDILIQKTAELTNKS